MANTTLIGLNLPVTGTLSGTWGDTVNNAISQIVDVAVAGTQTISTDADITLTLTTGSSASTGLTANSSQYAVILWTASGTATRTITVPATSKTYVVINKTGSTQSIIVIGATGTGVTIVAGEKAVVAFDGTNYVKVASNLATALTGIVPVANGGTNLSSGTSGGVLAYTASGTLASSAALTQYGVVYGGGAGVAPSATAAGTSTTVLHGNASGAPTFGAVSLTADVTGNLPAANGGTGVANNALSTITISGAFATTLTVSNTTSVALPTTGTLATLAGTETLTNKTLTSPVIATIVNSGTLTLPTSTDTLVGRATTDTLTNKTLTNPTLTTPVLGTPTSGNLSTCTADGTNAVGYRNIPLSGTKTASYTLVAGDVGKFIILGTSGLVVIPASVFAIGDAISVFNNTTASITCTSSAITAYLGGTNTVVTSFSLATRGVCTILFVTTSVVVITGNVS